jgi:hypothetical protein
MRRLRIGFFVGAAFALVVDISITAAYGVAGQAAEPWWAFNIMSTPCMFVWVQASPPPMGEGVLTGWDWGMLIIAFVSSCLSWGLVGAMIGWLSKWRWKTVSN